MCVGQAGNRGRPFALSRACAASHGPDRFVITHRDDTIPVDRQRSGAGLSGIQGVNAGIEQNTVNHSNGSLKTEKYSPPRAQRPQRFLKVKREKHIFRIPPPPLWRMR
jgi:hypothetical protein